MQTKVVKAAILSRILIICIIIISSFIANEYDISTTVLDQFGVCSTGWNKIVLRALRPLVRWDAIYYLDITEHGYRYEQQFAFFPGLPYLIRYLVKLAFADQFVCPRIAFIVTGVLISNICFVSAALALYRWHS